jgi:hexosaminidase
MQEGRFALAPSFAVAITNDAGARLPAAAARMLRRLSGRTGLFFPQDYISSSVKADTVAMLIDVKRSGKVELGEDESYYLEITNSRIRLTAETDLGAMHGLETLLQLLAAEEKGYYFPCTVIKDYPRFAWRGLMLDASRHFMPVDVVKRNLDAMAAVKMNVFHWHLSDDQGFRVESKVFPELQQLCSDGLYYTQAQIKDVLAYASDRGIRVYAEFDIPGHSTSWFAAHPELASGPGPYTIERHWGIFNPVFDPTREETYKFFDAFFAEMTSLFPDPYMHIGGDENNGKQWKANPAIIEYMKTHDIPDTHALQTMFNRRILAILTKYDKRMVGWDEILHPDLPKNSVIQSWRGQKGLFEAARKGYQAILSNGYYIDLIQSAEYHYLNDPIPPDSINALSESERTKILGGEATSWAELVTPENVDSRIWPRTAAIAERLWSASSVRDIEDMYRRLDDVSFHLEELGLTHLKNHEMMVRRLAGNGDAAALETLMKAIEPVKNYARHFQGVTYTSFSPYTRVVDAALPEAMTARRFRQQVRTFLVKDDRAALDEVVALAAMWKNNHAQLLLLIQRSPVLKEIQPLSENLSALAGVALEAASAATAGTTAAKARIDEYRAIIEKAKKPYGQAEIMITAGVAELVDRVAVAR